MKITISPRRRYALLAPALIVTALLPSAPFSGASRGAVAAAPPCASYQGVTVEQSLAVINGGATMQIMLRNNNDTCSQLVGLATYKRFSPDNPGDNVYNQQLFDSMPYTLGPNETKTLSAALPPCAYQADAFYGPILSGDQLNSGLRYGNLKLDWRLTDDSVGYCPQTPPTATNTPLPPTATKTNTPVPSTPTKTDTPVPPTATKTNTPVLPTATNTPVPPCRANSEQAHWSATETAIARATQTAIAAIPTCTPVAPSVTNTPIPPTATNTPVPPTATHTNTPVPPTATNTPHYSPPAPTQTPEVIVKYQTATPPTPVTIIKYLPAPTSTPAPVSAVAPVRVKVVTKTRYKTHLTTRYHDVTRVKTLVRVKTVVRTIVRYKTITRVKLVTRVRTLVNHKVVYTTKVRRVTVVRYKTRVIVRHKTVVRTVMAYRYIHHPQTGRFASPAPAARLASLPPMEARLSIARLGIHDAPVWARSFIANADGSLRYDIVPSYGATRFSQSAPFGHAGMSLLSGHDDIYGSIFRYLGTMRRGDVVRVTEGRRVYQYVVRSVTVVTPDDVRLLNAAYTRPTLALISCTPYWVDTHRVVVIAQMA